MKTADVFVNIPVKSIARAYTYRVPQELAKIVKPGVSVEFVE